MEDRIAKMTLIYYLVQDPQYILLAQFPHLMGFETLGSILIHMW